MASSSRVPTIAEHLTALCFELVQVSSLQGQGQELADYLENWARAQRQLTRDDVIRHGNTLVIGSPSSMRPCIALVGHLDTPVLSDNPPSPHVIREYSGRPEHVVGIGAANMKGAIAVMMALVETLELERLPFALMLALYDRTSSSKRDNGLQVLLDDYDLLHQADLAVMMEPSENNLQVGCAGLINARVSFRCESANILMMRPDSNPMHRAGSLLTALKNRPRSESAIEGYIFVDVMTATLASGGKARNLSPNVFELNLNYQFSPAATTRQSVSVLEAFVREHAPDATLDIVEICEAAPLPTHSVIVQHLQRVGNLVLEPKHLWNDVSRIAAAGIDAVNFGPGANPLLNPQNESVSVEAMVRSYHVLRKVLTTTLESM